MRRFQGRRTRGNGLDASFATRKVYDPNEEAYVYEVTGFPSERVYYAGFSKKEADGVVSYLEGRPTMDIRSLSPQTQELLRAHRRPERSNPGRERLPAVIEHQAEAVALSVAHRAGRRVPTQSDLRAGYAIAMRSAARRGLRKPGTTKLTRRGRNANVSFNAKDAWRGETAVERRKRLKAERSASARKGAATRRKRLSNGTRLKYLAVVREIEGDYARRAITAGERAENIQAIQKARSADEAWSMLSMQRRRRAP